MPDAKQLTDLLNQAADIKTIEMTNDRGNNFPVVITPPGFNATSLEAYMDFDDKPRRIITNQRLDDIESFTNYTNAHASTSTNIYSCRSTNRIKARFDDYMPNEPNHCGHTASIEFSITKEFARWLHIEGRPLSQQEFIEFIQDNADDVREPTAADLLTQISELQATKKTDIASKVDITTGGFTIEVKSEDGLSKSLQLPREIKIGVLIFEHERSKKDAQAWPVTFQIRTKIRDGQITFRLCNNRIDLLQEKAFNENKTALLELINDVDNKPIPVYAV